MMLGIGANDALVRRPRSSAGLLACLVFFILVQTTFAQQRQPTSYDLVFTGGRVMDPESGLDAARDVGITGGRIAAISRQRLTGKQVLDVSGLVVAPGFVDLHAHGQDLKSSQLQARDGVTTALEMEVGTLSIPDWYAARAGKALINFGVSAGHRQVRIRVKNGLAVPDALFSPEAGQAEKLTEWKYKNATAPEIDELIALLDRGVTDGALGIGMIIQHTPGARREEILRVFQLAARRGVPTFAHVRSMSGKEPDSSLEAVQEVIADAAATGASLHIFHITSSGLRQTPVCLDMIAGARRRGIDVTTEAYPYTAASTSITAATFDPGWQDRLGITFNDLQWTATSERLTEQSFQEYRRKGGLVIMHMIPEEVADLAVANPLVLISSDGLPFLTGGEHPRGAGTFARVLGHYVREKKALTLMDALRKMTLMPARRLDGYVPQMKNKGRTKVGADADLTIFDANRVLDRSTFEKPMQPSEGIVHVLVGGVFVVRDSELVDSVYPGRAIRRTPAVRN